MQVIIDFLLEYYIWVLAVLVILLITVIGFLADSKKKKKLRKKADDQSSANITNNEGFGNQTPNLNMGINSNTYNPQAPNMNGFNASSNISNNMPGDNGNSINQTLSSANVGGYNQNMINSNMNSGINNQNMVNNPENSSASGEAFFTPVSDQVPKFNSMEVEIPRAIEPAPIVMNNPMSNGINMQVPSAPTPVVEPTVVSNVNMQSGGPNVVNAINETVPVEVAPQHVPVMQSPVINNVGQTQGPVTMIPNNQVINNVTPEMMNSTSSQPTYQNGVQYFNPSGIQMQGQNNAIPVTNTPSDQMVNNQQVVNQTNQMGNTMEQGQNNAFLSGGSTFITGTSQQTMNNQNPINNGNWKL